MNNKQDNEDAFERFMNIENNDPAKRLQIVHNEHANKKEYVPDEIPVFHQPKKKKSRNIPAFLMILFTILAACMIGLLFGYGVLQMFIFIDNDTTASVPVSDISQPVATSETNAFTMSELSGYILQAGVFSERENAMEWQENVLPSNIPSIIWEQDAQFYLFTGVFETEDIAKLKATEFGGAELELYTKQWATSQADIELTNAEASWLEEFQAIWIRTLTAKDTSAFTELIQEIPGSVILQDLTKYLSSNKDSEVEQFYLESMYLYNQLSKDVK